MDENWLGTSQLDARMTLMSDLNPVSTIYTPWHPDNIHFGDAGEVVDSAISNYDAFNVG